MDAANRYKRIVQHGTQIRSVPAIREGIRKVREGYLGDVYMARGICFKWRDTIGRRREGAGPAGVDYDLWTGPAPCGHSLAIAFTTTGTGSGTTATAISATRACIEMDMARWGLGLGFPDKVSAIGGHFMFDDDQETPNDLCCAFEFNPPDGKRR